MENNTLTMFIVLTIVVLVLYLAFIAISIVVFCIKRDIEELQAMVDSLYQKDEPDDYI